jgi:hypothetical protein
MSANPVEKHDWKNEPYRLDPNRGYLLCRPCWDGTHFNPPYKDANGTSHPKTANCKQGLCHCGCRPEFQDRKRKPKFTGEGQLDIPETEPLFIGPKAEELRAQVEMLKK